MNKIKLGKCVLLLIVITHLFGCRDDDSVVHEDNRKGVEVNNDFTVYESVKHKYYAKTDTVLLGEEVECVSNFNFDLHRWYLDKERSQSETQRIINFEPFKDFDISHKGGGVILSSDQKAISEDTTRVTKNIVVLKHRDGSPTDFTRPINQNVRYRGEFGYKGIDNRLFTMTIKDTAVDLGSEVNHLLYCQSSDSCFPIYFINFYGFKSFFSDFTIERECSIGYSGKLFGQVSGDSLILKHSLRLPSEKDTTYTIYAVKK